MASSKLQAIRRARDCDVVLRDGRTASVLAEVGGR